MEHSSAFEWSSVDPVGFSETSGRGGSLAVLAGHFIILLGQQTRSLRSVKEGPALWLGDILDLKRQEWRPLPHYQLDETLLDTRFILSAFVVDDSVVVFGHSEQTVRPPFYRLDHLTFHRLDLVTLGLTFQPTYGEAPHIYQFHESANYYEHGRKLFVCSFKPGNRYQGSLAALDIDTALWQIVKTEGEQPPSPKYHSSCIMNHTLFVLGGIGVPLTHDCSKLYLVRLNQAQVRSKYLWECVTVGGMNPGRRYACTLLGLGNGRLLLFGGCLRHVFLNSTCILERAFSEKPEWNSLSRHEARYNFTGELPSVRTSPQCILTSNRMIVLGGYVAITSDMKKYYELKPQSSRI